MRIKDRDSYKAVFIRVIRDRKSKLTHTPNIRCDGQTLPSEWDTSVYAKEGGVWKALVTMGSPAS